MLEEGGQKDFDGEKGLRRKEENVAKVYKKIWKDVVDDEKAFYGGLVL